MNDFARHSLLVFLGSGVGGVARFAFGETARLVIPQYGSAFPWATLSVNVVGCLAIGVLAPLLRHDLAALILTGVLGGFTTFSTFGRETIELWSSGRQAMACAYVLASVLAGIGAAAIGYCVTDFMHKTA